MKNGELFLYYVERSEAEERLVQFSCHKKAKRWVRTRKYNILSLTVAEDIILVLENKETQKKIVAQIVNEDFDGSEIEFGRMISDPD